MQDAEDIPGDQGSWSLKRSRCPRRIWQDAQNAQDAWNDQDADLTNNTLSREDTASAERLLYAFKTLKTQDAQAVPDAFNTHT